ncbi:hypothetical protein PHET_06496 [Paragonimus heterotremus]|uniref:Uncharacterized protein n=1 Tax=Paragonimus heterotremus TaxID=100268 RepID=A0A8J4T655_9TREM|nr:hypothetical protein PHET_06496 [Paragonimus heterotremus]
MLRDDRALLIMSRSESGGTCLLTLYSVPRHTVQTANGGRRTLKLWFPGSRHLSLPYIEIRSFFLNTVFDMVIVCLQNVSISCL